MEGGGTGSRCIVGPVLGGSQWRWGANPTVPPPPIIDNSGLDCFSRPAGLDSCVAPRPGLSPHDKATLAIDAIDNELPDRSMLPFEFFELAVIALLFFFFFFERFTHS